MISPIYMLAVFRVITPPLLLDATVAAAIDYFHAMFMPKVCRDAPADTRCAMLRGRSRLPFADALQAERADEAIARQEETPPTA